MAKKDVKAKEIEATEEVVAETPVQEVAAPEVAETTEETDADADEKLAKAGKRSAKALKEADEKADKEARKEAGDTAPLNEAGELIIKKGPKPQTRPKLERRGKKYRKIVEGIDLEKVYGLKEALELAAKTSTSSFEGSVELHVKLGVDPRHADQNIRSTVTLPHGTGKAIRVAVFAPSDQHAAATKAGADYVAEDELLQKLDKEELDFDVLIATPQLMAKLGKYARLLGPKGLMPNPKSGTVSAKVADAVTQAKAGRVEFRVDKQGIVHQAVGKTGFDATKLYENAKAVMDALLAAKPNSVKGSYLLTISVASTMGPGIKVDTANL